MTQPNDALNEEYTIDTPENISIDYAVAGIGSRFIAALIDSSLLAGTLIVAQTLLLVTMALLGNPIGLFNDGSVSWGAGLAMALYALASFALIWGYFILFEWLWNGQTPGKRIGKIRIVRMDGSPPRFLDIAVRNLVRIIDFLPFGYGFGLVTMFFNRESRRLGDLAAGVIVVKDRGEIRLADITGPIAPSASPSTHRPPHSMPQLSPVHATAELSGMTAPSATTRETDPPPLDADRLAQRFPTMRRLRVADLELIQESLRRHDAGTLDVAILNRLAQAMNQKVGGEPLVETHWSTSRRRLLDIVDGYRRFHQ